MKERVNLFGIRIDNLSEEDCLKKIKELAESEKKGYVVTPNVAHIVLLQKDKEFLNIYENALLVLCDSQPLIFVSRFLGEPLKERLAGSDLFPNICEMASKMRKRIFLLGGERGGEKIVVEKLRSLYNEIQVSIYSPPFGFERDLEETKKIIDLINSFSTDFLFVFVGTPKSEKWIYKNLESLNITLALSFGGALDYLTGTKRRAPIWMQKAGLEWLLRLLQEPRRLWKRYLIGNTIFIWLVFRELVKKLFIKKV